MANTIKDLILDDEAIESIRVRRVPLGDNLVFLFEPDAPRKGNVACNLLVEGDPESLQARWMDISRHIYVRTPANQVVRANQISAGLINGTSSPVQRLVFDTEGHVPVSIGCDDPEFMLEVYFPFEVLRALSDDMGAQAPPVSYRVGMAF